MVIRIYCKWICPLNDVQRRCNDTLFLIFFSGPSGATLYKEERLDPPEQVCLPVAYGINYVETFNYGYECLIDSNRTKNKYVSYEEVWLNIQFLIDFKICHEWINILQLSPEGAVNSGLEKYIPRRKASRYISSAVHRPWGG